MLKKYDVGEKQVCTKAGMLSYLKEHIPSINILPLLVIRSGCFFSDSDETVGTVLEFAAGRRLAVRSSSVMEDAADYSNAGKFRSILNVIPEQQTIRRAVEEVYRSYGTDMDEEILIQPMLEDIRKSGVAFTADMDTFADYYTVNFHEGEDSAAVTGGSTDSLKTFIKYKGDSSTTSDRDIKKVLEACHQIEGFLGEGALDIEFATDKAGKVFILQVRPIAKGDKRILEKVDLSPVLKRIYKKVRKLSARHPFLLGHTTCFGVMPDWNPAEILGACPKKLSVSLYKELVTDSVWAHQRHDYGYRDLTMHPLMVSFCGIPYIDTRITFNSFVPEKLNVKIAEKLVDYYLDKLAQYPKYHDKIEFEIVFSCYYFGLHEKLKELLGYGFNENEITRIEFSLLDVTNRIISPGSGLYKRDIRKIAILDENYNKIISSDISLVDKIYWLIEECKAYGTLPFAGVARAAFIAIQFLKSFVDRGIITAKEYDSYMNSLNTVNKKLNYDLRKYYRGEISKEIFLSEYGHIRPGTYDIMSKRYDEAFDEYFAGNVLQDKEEAEEAFCFSEEQMALLQTELEQNGLLITAKELLVFIKEAIEGREYLKFIFTKSVSKILQLIEELGKRADISKEDMSYLDIFVVKQLYSDLYTGDIRSVFKENIRNNKIQYQSAVQIKLPAIIVKPEDIYSFYLLNEEPNFVTQKCVTADIVLLPEADCGLEGKVVFIQAADPGYDFLFSKKIGGLVTQFGGANSHMAIRCAELGIPAVIGAGEANYREWNHYRKITIDCLKKQVLRIQ